MCGIFGLARFDEAPVNLKSVQMATDALRHRGPDDEGYLLGNTQTGQIAVCGGPDTVSPLNLPRLNTFSTLNFNLAFGFRRLAILDLSSAGHQPMSSSDGRFWLIFNGEIYNYLELRAELERCGHTFGSNGDSEVLLAAYVQWGVEALNRLVGMFAFAIWDTRTGKILLARDFFGIKPLYYTCWHNGFAFASEIKALLVLPQVNRRINPQRLYEYLRFRLTDFGSGTLFDGIHQLPAAHYLQLTTDGHHKHPLHPQRYWQVDLGRRSQLSFEAAGEQLRELFMQNIRLHLRSDVPVGVALSGGIDSSSIVMAMRYVEGQSLGLHTFSHIAHDPQISEEQWINLIVQVSAAEVHKVKPTPQELMTSLEPLIELQDEPFGSTSIFAQYRVFQLAQQAGIKVMLDGQGADELLGGYPLYLAARLASLLRQREWREAGRFLSRASKMPGFGKFTMLLESFRMLLPDRFQAIGRDFTGNSMFPAWLNAAWFREQGVAKSFNLIYGQEILRDQLYQSFVETSLPMLLRYEDRNSMAFSIESRVPFLTPALVNFVFSLPESYIIAPDGYTKSIFRQAMRGIVPNAILDRRDKIGFATPERAWLLALRPWVEDVLQSETAAQIPALNLPAIKAEWQAVLNGRQHFDFRIWRWLNFICWVKRYEVGFC